MSLGSINNNSYSQLQSALEQARQRTAQPTETAAVETPKETRIPQSSGGGSLFGKLYGTKTVTAQAQPSSVGSQLDVYA